MPLNSPNQRPRRKLALLLNMISPARLALYKGLASHFDLLILHGGRESNRDSWGKTDQMIPEAKIKRVWGWQSRIPRKVNGKNFDYRYLHIPPGYMFDLVRFRPDVVISNEMGLRTVLALLYGTLFRKPVWIWWGGTLHTEQNVGFIKRMVRGAISRWAKRWISYGHSSTGYLTSIGIKCENILEIQNSVDEQLFLPDSNPGVDRYPQRPVLLHVGQFTRRKGIELLLRAAATLQEEGQHFSLVLVGSGPEKTTMEELSNTLGLKNIFFEPSCEPVNMPAVYSRADALIFPTLEDVWGLVANEAVLCGVPVLCSKYAGCCEELFEPNSIFDPNNPVEFVAKLRKAISGRLPGADPSRLRTTRQRVSALVSSLEGSIAGRKFTSGDSQAPATELKSENL